MKTIETPWEKLNHSQRQQARTIHAADEQGGEIEIERCRFFVKPDGKLDASASFTVD